MRLPPPPDAQHSGLASTASDRGAAAPSSLPLPPVRRLPPPNKRTGTFVDADGNTRWRANHRIVSHDPVKQKPVTWGPRYDIMLWMHVAGQRNCDIAAALKYTPSRVSAIINSPLFQSRKAQALDELRTSTIEDVLEKIRREAGPNFQFLVECRNDEGQEPRLRLAAAKQIATEVDRVYPRRTERKEERTIRLTIDAETLRRMSEAMAQAKGLDPLPLDAEFARIEDEGRPPRPDTREATSADDYLREVEEAEAAAAREH